MTVIQIHQTSSQRMMALARTFPTLRSAPLEPWCPEALDDWGCHGACHGAVHAARFVLAVWHGRMGFVGKPRPTPEKSGWRGIHRFPVDTHWRIGPFDVVDAMSTWDATHRAAFITWASEPWYP